MSTIADVLARPLHQLAEVLSRKIDCDCRRYASASTASSGITFSHAVLFELRGDPFDQGIGSESVQLNAVGEQELDFLLGRAAFGQGDTNALGALAILQRPRSPGRASSRRRDAGPRSITSISFAKV